MNVFKKNFQWSTEQAENDIAIIRSHYSQAAQIQQADESLDKKGVDYIVTFPNANPVNIDVKRRAAGSSKYWKDRNDPELAIEINSNEHKVGWTLNPEYLTDKVLYIFDKSDSDTSFLLDYRKLQNVTTKFKDFWLETFGEKTQENRNNGTYYKSKCLFIPFSEIKRAFNSPVMLILN